MATAKKKEVVKDEKYWNEKVPFYAFKDSGKYSADIIAIVNGRRFQIKRGEQVMIPRYVYEVLMNQMKQDNETADFLTRSTDAFLKEASKNGL